MAPLDTNTTSLRIAMVAGEPSGDLLGADLIKSLKHYYPNLIVEGIGGSAMKQAGCRSFFALECLSIMGLVEPIKRLPKLLSMRHQLKKYFLKNPPDCFIGIDAPDFNLNIEIVLKKAGIKTVHYVSPTIWAWRANRIKKIKRAADLVLCLFPFEPPIYHRHSVAAQFVGHPLAKKIAMEYDQSSFRQTLGLSASDKVLTILPGSRDGEVNYLTKPFMEAARICQQEMPKLKIVIAILDRKRRQQFERLSKNMQSQLSQLTIVEGQTKTAMIAADVILLASGTATLEAMLFKRPMVVAYKTSAISYHIVKRLIKTPFVSFPNILAQQALVPELLQQHARADTLATEIMTLFKKDHYNLIEYFRQLHCQLQSNHKYPAAHAILSLLSQEKS